MLSHCAIVAREYGIPAIVSVAGAMRRLAGARVRIDGTNGLVQVLSSSAGDTGEEHPAGGMTSEGDS